VTPTRTAATFDFLGFTHVCAPAADGAGSRFTSGPFANASASVKAVAQCASSIGTTRW